MTDFLGEAQAGGGMAVFLFHGIGGEHLQLSAAVHRDLIACLKRHRADVWVNTFQDALDWAKAHPGAPEAR